MNVPKLLIFFKGQTSSSGVDGQMYTLMHTHTHIDVHCCYGEAGQRSTCMTFRKSCHLDQSGRKSPLWEVNIFLCLTVGGRREVVAATDSSFYQIETGQGGRNKGRDNHVQGQGDHRLEESD